MITRSLLLAWVLLLLHSTAVAWEFNGDAGAELRWFPNDPRFPGQSEDRLGLSLLFKPISILQKSMSWIQHRWRLHGAKRVPLWGRLSLVRQRWSSWKHALAPLICNCQMRSCKTLMRRIDSIPCRTRSQTTVERS